MRQRASASTRSSTATEPAHVPVVLADAARLPLSARRRIALVGQGAHRTGKARARAVLRHQRRYGSPTSWASTTGCERIASPRCTRRLAQVHKYAGPVNADVRVSTLSIDSAAVLPRPTRGASTWPRDAAREATAHRLRRKCPRRRRTTLCRRRRRCSLGRDGSSLLRGLLAGAGPQSKAVAATAGPPSRRWTGSGSGRAGVVQGRPAVRSRTSPQT